MTLPFVNAPSVVYSFLVQLTPNSALWIQFVPPPLQTPAIDLHEILNLPLSTILGLYPISAMQVLSMSSPNFQTEEVDPEVENPVPRFFPPSQLTGFHVVPK